MKTKIIPDHGLMAIIADFKEYRKMLFTVHNRIAKLLKSGKSVKEIVVAKPTVDFDPKWGKGFLKPD